MRRLVTLSLVIPLLGALAAPVAAQSQTTTEELLSSMVTDEVEPGVFRVINDGMQDLAKAHDTDLVAGHDGSIWLLRPQRFLRLGDDEWHEWGEWDEWREWPVQKPDLVDFEVAPDGTVWVQADQVIVSFDGEVWTTHHTMRSFEFAPDGTFWATWQDPETWREHFGYLDEDGWQAVGRPEGELLVASPDDIWAVIHGGIGPTNVVRFVDGAWHQLVGVDGTEATWARPEDPGATDGNIIGGSAVGLGPDGTFWGVFGFFDGSTDLVRFDGSEWSRWSLGDTGFGPWPSAVAPDGSVWLEASCDGLGRFDGVTWDRYLSSLCVEAIDITADGAVWLLAKEPEDDLRHVYVITPEAVAGTR